MVYLSLIVSETPIVPTLSMNQKVHVWQQVQVPDEFDTLKPEKLRTYLIPVAEVMATDLNVKSKLMLASADGTSSS